QRVKKGEPLVEIEDNDYQARVAQAEADVLGAEAAIKNLKAWKAAQHAQVAEAEDAFLDKVLAVFCMNALLSRQLWLRSLRSASALDAEGPCDSGSIGRVGLGTIGDVPLLDVQASIAHCSRRVLEQHLLLRGRHQPEQIARL